MIGKFSLSDSLSIKPVALTLFGLLLISCLQHTVHAQQPIILDGGAGEEVVDTAPYTEFLRDETGALSFDDVLNREFQPLNGPVDFGYTSDKFWLRFGIQNENSVAAERLFSTTARFMRPLQVYLVRSDGRVEQILANDQTNSFHQRPYPRFRFLAAPINLAAGESAEIYYRLGAGGRVSMGVGLAPVQNVLAEQHRAEINSAFFNSILLTLVLVNLFHFIAVRRLAYLGYVLYESFNALYVTHIEGFTWQYLWPGLPDLNANATPVIASAGIAVGCLFATSYLETWHHARRMHKVLLSLSGIAGLTLIVSLIDSRIGNQVSAALLPVSMGVSVVAAVAALRQGSYLARYFLVAWSIYFVAAMLYSLSVLGLVANTQFLEVLGLYKFCIIVQAAIFSMGLADQVRRINSEHRKTLYDLARNLEQRLADSQEKLRLERENEKSRIALVEKSKLLAATSHDLNQPIQALRHTVSGLKNDHEIDVTREKISRTLDHLESVTTDALQRASSGLADVLDTGKLQSIVLGELFREVVEDFDQTAQGREIDLRYFASKIVLVSYPLPLKRCLMNLLANAISHSDSPDVLLGARFLGDQVVIEVRDRGRGIEEGRIEKLLLPLNRISDSSGYGLGLSIVKSICDEYGWALELKSEPSKGTVAKITLPIRQQ